MGQPARLRGVGEKALLHPAAAFLALAACAFGLWSAGVAAYEWRGGDLAPADGPSRAATAAGAFLMVSATVPAYLALAVVAAALGSRWARRRRARAAAGHLDLLRRAVAAGRVGPEARQGHLVRLQALVRGGLPGAAERAWGAIVAIGALAGVAGLVASLGWAADDCGPEAGHDCGEALGVVTVCLGCSAAAWPGMRLWWHGRKELRMERQALAQAEADLLDEPKPPAPPSPAEPGPVRWTRA